MAALIEFLVLLEAPSLLKGHHVFHHYREEIPSQITIAEQ